MKKLKTDVGELIEIVNGASSLKSNTKMPIQLQFKFGAIITITKCIIDAFNDAFNALQEKLGEVTNDSGGNDMLAIPNVKLPELNRISKEMRAEQLTIELPEFSLKELGANEKNANSPNKFGIPSSTIFDLFPLIEDKEKEKYFGGTIKTDKIKVPDFGKYLNGKEEIKAESTN